MNISRSKSNTQTSVFLYIHGMFHLKLFNDGHKCPSNIFNFMEKNIYKMKILRLNKNNKNNKKDEKLSLHIKCKCKCGCKVLIDDITDLIYLNDHFCSGSLYRDTSDVIVFGYICPKCNKVISLPFRHCKRITNYLYDSGIDIIEYLSKCDWWKPFLLDKDSPEYDKEVGIAIEYFTKYNAPLPSEMKSCVMEELFRYSIKSERFRDVLNK